MKIRTGFVSNSSSASYIVNIKGIDFAEFCNKMETEYSFSDYFNVESMMKSLDGHLERYIKGDDSTDSMKDLIEEFRVELEEQKVKLKAVNPDKYYDVVRCGLEFHQVGLKETDDGVELTSFTSMHNDYDEGVSSIMNEIVLYFLFETDYKLVCTMESD